MNQNTNSHLTFKLGVLKVKNKSYNGYSYFSSTPSYKLETQSVASPRKWGAKLTLTFDTVTQNQ